MRSNDLYVAIAARPFRTVAVVVTKQRRLPPPQRWNPIDSRRHLDTGHAELDAVAEVTSYGTGAGEDAAAVTVLEVLINCTALSESGIRTNIRG